MGTSLGRRAFDFVVGCILMVGIVVANYLFAERRFLEKYDPEPTVQFAVMAVACLIAAIFFIRAIVTPSHYVGWASQPIGGWMLVGIVTGLAIPAISALSMFLVPENIAAWVTERTTVALLQELFIATGVVALAVTAWRARDLKKGKILILAPSLIVALMALALLLLFMEEISWGQHYLGWATPELFSANLQLETNLHNFYTHRFELVYYGAAMIAFIGLPLLATALRNSPLSSVSYYIPPIHFMVIVAPISAYIYRDWPIVPYQIAFFFTLMAGLILLRLTERGEWKWALVLGLNLLFMILVQLACFTNGGELVRGHEPTEMRETQIAHAIAFYGLWLWHKVKVDLKFQQSLDKRCDLIVHRQKIRSAPLKDRPVLAGQDAPMRGA